MKTKNLTGSVLTAVLLVLSIGCDVTGPEVAPGTIQGTGSVNVDNQSFEDYHFNRAGDSYGHITISYEKFPDRDDIEITAPYGIQEGSGSTAPSGGYVSSVDAILGYSYFFKPDSIHYGYIEISILNLNSTAYVGFDWLIQTEPNNRDFY